MLNSSTGQAVGILLPFWSYLPTNRISPKGFLYPVSRNEKRFGSCNDRQKKKQDAGLLGGRNAMFRQILVTYRNIRQDNFPTGIFAETAVFCKEKGSRLRKVKDIFVYYGISETWNLITGDIKPSCCIYKYGMLFVPETEVCLGLVSENANFPRGYDMKDLGRVERLLEKTGVFKIPDEISLAEIETKLSKFSEIEKFLDEFSAKDEETLLR